MPTKRKTTKAAEAAGSFPPQAQTVASGVPPSAATVSHMALPPGASAPAQATARVSRMSRRVAVAAAGGKSFGVVPATWPARVSVRVIGVPFANSAGRGRRISRGGD